VRLVLLTPILAHPIIASLPTLPTSLTLGYAHITAPQLLKHSLTPLDGEN
jgi:hypothetical protein